MTNPITITRALVELKTLHERISNSVSKNKYIRVLSPDQHAPTDDFKSTAERNLQSIRDMIKYRAALKGAIVRSNAETKVTIAGKQYTVADALERKSSIVYEQSLLDHLKTQLREAIHARDGHNSTMETRLERMLTAEVGKDKRTDPEILRTLTESYRKANMATLQDPLHLEQMIDDLESEINAFEDEVDISLSESNARTLLSVF